MKVDNGTEEVSYHHISTSLAAEIDQISYNYDTVQYRDTVNDRDAQVANIPEDIRNGNTEYLYNRNASRAEFL